MAHTSSDYHWVVVVAGFLAFTFAFGMGANDIPNAFATTIASKTLTMKQAVLMAGVFELAGAYSMSKKVEGKIRNEVISDTKFTNEINSHPPPDPGDLCPPNLLGGPLLMWGLTCALAASSVWVILVTWMGWPISSTHTIVSSMVVLTFVLPVTIHAIDWRFAENGKIRPVYGIFLSWIVTPPAAAFLSAVSFSALRSFVLQPVDSERRFLHFLPAVWALTAMTITLLIFFSFPLFKENKNQYVPFLVSVVISALVYAMAYVFGIPHAQGRLKSYDNSVRRRVDEEVLQLQERFTGGQGGGGGGGAGRDEEEEEERQSAGHGVEGGRGVPSAAAAVAEAGDGGERLPGREGGRVEEGRGNLEEEEDHDDDQENVAVVVQGQEPEVRPVARWNLRNADGNLAPEGQDELDLRRRLRGVHEARVGGGGGGGGGEEGRVWDAIVDLYCRVEMQTFGRELVFSEATQRRQELAQRYSPRVEELFYPLQILPACALAFAHGANDVANQLAPFALIFEYGRCRALTRAEFFGMKTVVGIAMCTGFALLGYKVTRNIGGLTLMTPSRSFTCQVCSAFLVAICSVAGVPVSTTQILIGSTIGVGAADNYRTVDWWLFGKFLLSWMATALAAGGLTAVLFSVTIYSPSAVGL